MNKQPVKHVQQFHVTQQLGYKPILYCWCGAYMDLNKQKYPRTSIKAFKIAHEGVCEPQVKEVKV